MTSTPSVAVLLVTCCLEPSRLELLKQVIDNLKKQAPYLSITATVFDNASTEPGTRDQLRRFSNVWYADRNVGYWSAIDWWLDWMKDDPPQYTYIIESDMIHYGMDSMGMNVLECAAMFLDDHPELGAMRLHEYSVDNRHLFDKDAPRPDSRRNLWQSHTNKVTGQPVVLEHLGGSYWKTNFLTQLPALNRYPAMKACFDELAQRRSFTELDFQRLYHSLYPHVAILDGGIFHCDLNPYGSKGVTGSWTSPEELAKLGYQGTRFASITPRDQYTVTPRG